MTFAEMIASDYFTILPGTDTSCGVIYYTVVDGYEVETVEGEVIVGLSYHKPSEGMTEHWFLNTDESSYYFDMHENVVIHVEKLTRINLGTM